MMKPSIAQIAVNLIAATSYTPITLDKDRTTINKFGNIGPERSGSLLDVHTTQYS